MFAHADVNLSKRKCKCCVCHLWIPPRSLRMDDLSKCYHVECYVDNIRSKYQQPKDLHGWRYLSEPHRNMLRKAFRNKLKEEGNLLNGGILCVTESQLKRYGNFTKATLRKILSEYGIKYYCTYNKTKLISATLGLKILLLKEYLLNGNLPILNQINMPLDLVNLICIFTYESETKFEEFNYLQQNDKKSIRAREHTITSIKNALDPKEFIFDTDDDDNDDNDNDTPKRPPKKKRRTVSSFA